MSYLKYTSIWKIKEHSSFFPNVFFRGLFLWMFSKHNSMFFTWLCISSQLWGLATTSSLRLPLNVFFSFYDKDDFEEGTFDVLYTQFSDCASIEYNSCFLHKWDMQNDL